MTRLTRKQKKNLYRLIVTALLFVLGIGITHVFDIKGWYSLLPILPSYIFIGWDVLYSAVREIGRGRLFGETFLMSVATLGALAIGEFYEGVAVMLFYKVGELFESCAQTNAKEAIKSLARLCPDSADVIREGEVLTVDISEVEIGERIAVMPGGRVPLDGIIVSGGANFDTSAMTGESMPVFYDVGDEISGGFICTDSKIEIESIRTHENSGSARIIALMEEAAAKKSKAESFIYRFSVIYTPIVVLAALLIALVPPMLIESARFTSYIHRALTFLVVSCPCALVISVPLTYFTAVGRAAKKGIIFKSNSALERLAKAKICAFDKTGTLTKGEFKITEIVSAQSDFSVKEILALAAALEKSSNHPIAKALVKEYNNRYGSECPSAFDVREIRGKGLEGVADRKKIICGNAAFLSELGFNVPKSEATTVHIAKENEYLGCIILADRVKTEAREASEALSRLSVTSVMLTGDGQKAAENAAKDAGIDRYYANLLPGDKVEIAEKLKGEGVLVFAGDGINDAPVISSADVGISMGGMGSDAAIEASDAVITDDNPKKIAFSIALARFADRIVKENVIFALFVKFAVIALASFNIVGMWWAVFADVGVSVIAILNSVRTLRFKAK